MNFFREFAKGIQYFLKSWPVIFNKGLWHYFAYPVVLKIIYLILVFTGMFALGSMLHDYIEEFLKFKDIPNSGHWLSWLKSFVEQ